jgi:DNA invertase Pin-like site-specific DNA recombinase
MAYDYRKLRGRIIEKFGSQKAFAQEMGLSEHTVSSKLNSKVYWKQPEIQSACDLLGINHDDVQIYFFTLKVQDIEQVI